jgi:hypothetical protein
MLLPTRTGSGESVPAAAGAETRAELIDRFGGVTAYVRSAASGAWRDEMGQVEHDEVVMVEVVAESFDREWWQSFARRLASRYQQKEMHIRVLAMELLTGGGR